MSPITEERIRTALRAATDRIVAPPDLAERVTATVPRPAARRSRLPLVLAPVAVVAVVAAAVLVVPRLGGPDVPAVAADEGLLHRRTGGNLAADATVTAEAVRVFLASARPAEIGASGLQTPRPGSRPDGEPRVLWAGRTGTGPAAIVAQREVGGGGPVVAVGFLGTVSGTLTLAAVSRATEGYDRLDGSLVGTGSRTLLVLDRGYAVTWSFEHSYEPGGGLRFYDRPVRFAGGAAAIDLPAAAGPEWVHLARPGATGPQRQLGLGAYPGEPVEGPRLPWEGDKRDPAAGLFPVGPAGEPWPDPTPEEQDRYGQILVAFRKAVWSVPSDRPLAGSRGDDAWYAWGRTPDGRRLAATDLAADGDPSRAYAVLWAEGRPPVVVAGGYVSRGLDVPFRLRLPDRQGWVVAAKGGSLSWRTGDGPWTDAGEDAALLPDAATEVRADGGGAIPLR